MPERLEDELLFGASLKAIKRENYLGERETIEALVRFAVAEFSEIMANEKTSPQSKVNRSRIGAKRLASTLLGKEKGFVPVEQWNKAGIIDEFLSKWLGLSEPIADKRMEQAVVKMFLDFQELFEFAGTDGVLEEQWKGRAEQLTQKYVNLFMGIDPVTNAMTLQVSI